MRVVLVSRFPRVDTRVWKRAVGAGLAGEGFELSVLYSRASLADQARAGVREEGLGAARRYFALRSDAAFDEEPSATLAAWADERGIDVLRVRRLEDAAAALERRAPDLLVLLGADIVPPTLLAVPRVGVINAHYGLLPAFRGMNVTEWSVLSGAPVGVTVHFVDAGIDTGAILLREEIPIAPGETFATLRRKHQDVAARLLVRAACDIRDGRAAPQAQDPAAGRQYYRMHPAIRRAAETKLRALAGGTGLSPRGSARDLRRP
jgi:folate-dependent phosphoribosylglycinamide formyltransferase PurN